MSPFMKRKRCCRAFKGITFFKPAGMPMSNLETNILEIDEMEAIHLCDYENLNQAQAAEQMNISTSTLQRLLYSGRKKIIDAIYSSKAIQINKNEFIEEIEEIGPGRGRCQNKGRKRGYKY